MKRNFLKITANRHEMYAMKIKLPAETKGIVIAFGIQLEQLQEEKNEWGQTDGKVEGVSLGAARRLSVFPCQKFDYGPPVRWATRTRVHSTS